MTFYSDRVSIELVFLLTVRTRKSSLYYFSINYLKDWMKQSSLERSRSLSIYFVDDKVLNSLRFTTFEI